MLHRFPATELRSLRQRALLSTYDVTRLTGVSRATLRTLEYGYRRPITRTLRRLLNLYAIHIAKLERLEAAWSTTAGTVPQAAMAGRSAAGEIPGVRFDPALPLACPRVERRRVYRQGDYRAG